MTGRAAEDTSNPERSELETVLASKKFARAPNISRILRYVCEQSLRGDAGSIKEYSIAVDALQRPASFSPDEDSIVRVEFSRLRKKLTEFYETEGIDHELQIIVPPTGYVPQFVSRISTPIDAEEPPLSAEQPAAAPLCDRGSEQPESRSEAREVADAAGTSQTRHATMAGIARWGLGWYLAVGAAILASCALLFIFASWSTTWGADVSPSSAQESTPAAAHSLSQSDLRIRMGVSGAEYRDSIGRTWVPDRYFSGGEIVARSDRVVRETYDPTLYSSFRQGEFSYDIPAKPGTYELHLHFAETSYGQEGPDSDGVNERMFNVTLNGKPLLTSFDIVLDARGANIADERIFKDVSPAEDGSIHLKFSAVKNKPTLCAIELVRSVPGKIRPIRIVAGAPVYWDKHGQMWGPDRYYRGGRSHRFWGSASNTDEVGLYTGHRCGAFEYAIPVPEGRYKLTLKFAELWYGPSNPGKTGGVGSRVFDVYLNGTALLKGFDILKAGGREGVVVDRAFHGLQPNAQGKLVLAFVPVRDYPSVSAIEVLSED